MDRKILIIEDDPTFGMMLQSFLNRNRFMAVLCNSVQKGKQALLSDSFDIILSDLRLPDGDGVMLLLWMKEKQISTPIIIMTGYGEVQTAVSAIRLGAFDFLEKPIQPDILQQKINQALSCDEKGDLLPSKPIKVQSDTLFLEGESEIAKEMYANIRLVAPTNFSVLILGESGTGKEHSAKLIHQLSKRADHPFMAVDCGSLSKELAPSELFGHKKGSFTSALQDKKGVFEIADKGTVFLDEIGNLSYDVQVQILRAIQEQRIRPIGATDDIAVNIRLIAATNEDLSQAITEGRFRGDLFHRLNEFAITVPPLRERTGDIPLFAYHFLEEANQELNKQIKRFSKEALEVLSNYHWSGNLRELRNAVRRAVLFTTTEEIQPNHLPLLKSGLKESSLLLQPDNEAEIIQKALQKAGGNKTLAAKILGIDRKTLYNKMHLLKMDL